MMAGSSAPLVLVFAAAMVPCGAAAQEPVRIQEPVVAPEQLVVPPPRQVEPLPAAHPVVRPRWELVVAGAGLLGSVWIADRMLTQNSISGPGPWFPLVGPWIQVGTYAGQPNQGGTIALLVLDGALQASGVGISIAGLVMRRRDVGLELPPRQMP